jgi:hypothetical protein
MPDLITLQNYKDYNAITNSNQDAKLQLIISSVSALIESYCGRIFQSTTYTESYDAKDSVISLNNYPVISITSVKTSTDGGLTQTTLVANSAAKDGYIVDLKEGLIYSQTGSSFLPSYEIKYRSLEVVYVAGYATIPNDIKLVTYDLVDYYKNNEQKPMQAMMNSSTENFTAPTTMFPPHIQRVLDLYRFIH